MTDGGEGRDPATAERCGGVLVEHVATRVVAVLLAILGFSLSDVAKSPSLDAESGLTKDSDVCVVDLQSERLKHVGLIILDGLEAPPR